jgi:hypothetical protein
MICLILFFNWVVIITNNENYVTVLRTTDLDECQVSAAGMKWILSPIVPFTHLVISNLYLIKRIQVDC